MDWTLTRISADIDFHRDGARIGILRVPDTNQNTAPAYAPVPVAVIQNGIGPRVLLTSGNHGDEYEGLIALLRLVRELEWTEVSGRLIVIPFLNAPAVRAAERCSPIDQVNLNRAFPGDPDGGPTSMIAHMVEHVLLPGSDLAVDLHSGGKVSEYGRCALVYRPQDEELYRANLEFAAVFGAPVTYLLSGMSDDRTFSTAAARQSVPCVATELGGLGTLNRTGLELAEAGIRRLLNHVGFLKQAGGNSQRPHSRFVKVESHDNNVYAPTRGLFQPCFEIGEEIKKGQVAGYLYSLDEPFDAPRVLKFKIGGLALVRQGPTLVEGGMRLAVVATPGEP